MSALLIDYTNVVSDEHTRLRKKLAPSPNSLRGFVPGLVIMTKEKIINHLGTLSAGEKRIAYINSEEFVDSISAHYYVMYNIKRKICVLPSESMDNLKPILQALFSGFPPDAILTVSIALNNPNFSKTLKVFIKNDFNSPYLAMKSPVYEEIPASIVLVRKNIPVEIANPKTTINKVMHVIEEYKKNSNGCSLYAQFSPRAVKFLQEASEMGITLDKNGKHSQKELTGELFVKDVERRDEKFIYIIDIDKESVSSGENENIDVEATRYNFHSHPKEAYIRHSVEKAWPSVTDYLGLLTLGNSTIFHCVATVEGVYIMSFSPYWGNNLKKVNRKFVDSHYDISYNEPYTPADYVRKVNKILYHKEPIYHVKFLAWDDASTIFRIYFAKTGSGCIVSQKIMDNYNLLEKV